MKKENILKMAIVLLCSVALIGLFLPYEKSYGEYRQYLKDYPSTIYMEEVNFKNKDVVDISILENFKVYKYALNNDNGNDWMYGEALINVIITITLIASIILILLFTILNKRFLIIIFSIVMGVSTLLMNYDIVDRGVIPSNQYTYGISYYLYLILTILILTCTIIQIILKKKDVPKLEKE